VGHKDVSILVGISGSSLTNTGKFGRLPLHVETTVSKSIHFATVTPRYGIDNGITS
jgi:hypothetical protein